MKRLGCHYSSVAYQARVSANDEKDTYIMYCGMILIRIVLLRYKGWTLCNIDLFYDRISIIVVKERSGGGRNAMAFDLDLSVIDFHFIDTLL